jgi:hypothetical protein
MVLIASRSELPGLLLPTRVYYYSYCIYSTVLPLASIAYCICASCLITSCLLVLLAYCLLLPCINSLSLYGFNHSSVLVAIASRTDNYLAYSSQLVLVVTAKEHFLDGSPAYSSQSVLLVAKAHFLGGCPSRKKQGCLGKVNNRLD